jgi:hypothetical protein
MHREKRTRAGLGLAGLTLWLALFGTAVCVLAGWPSVTPALPSTGLPTLISVEVWLRSPMLAVDAVLPTVRLLAWLAWGWTCATVLLRVGVNALDLATKEDRVIAGGVQSKL